HSVEDRVPEPSQQATLRSLGDKRTRQLLDRYIAAWDAVDIDGLVELLTSDVVWTMPPLSTWYQGLDAVIPLLREYPLTERWRHLPTQIGRACRVEKEGRSR